MFRTPSSSLSKITIAAAALSCIVFVSSTAAAEPELMPPQPPAAIEDDDNGPMLALAVGAGTSLVSMGTGFGIVSYYRDRTVRNAGLLGAQSGLTLAPLFAHMAVGETKRGLFFSLIPLTAEATLATLMAFYPSIITIAPVLVQYTYIGALSTSVFGAALGTLDAVRVGERRQRPNASAVRLFPMLGGGNAGVMIGGSL